MLTICAPVAAGLFHHLQEVMPEERIAGVAVCQNMSRSRTSLGTTTLRTSSTLSAACAARPMVALTGSASIFVTSMGLNPRQNTLLCGPSLLQKMHDKCLVEEPLTWNLRVPPMSPTYSQATHPLQTVLAIPLTLRPLDQIWYDPSLTKVRAAGTLIPQAISTLVKEGVRRPKSQAANTVAVFLEPAQTAKGGHLLAPPQGVQLQTSERTQSVWNAPNADRLSS